jgi:glycine cleavage system T protein (aminomethyltransferase)
LSPACCSRILTTCVSRPAPYEVRLDHVVKLDTPREFGGRDALRRIAAEGTPRLLTTLRIDGDDVPEYGAPVFLDGDEVGIVRSPSKSPTFGQIIAMTAIDRGLTDPGRRLQVALGDGAVTATVAPVPLYDTEKACPRA